MQEFRIFRALGLSFKAWFKNFIPFTILALVLFSPVIAWLWTLPSGDNLDDELVAFQKFLNFFQYGVWGIVALSALLSPMLVYRVIQQMNGADSSFMTSVKYGLRGFLPALILAGTTSLLQMIPMGGIAGIIVTCYWFVAAPAAVVEKLGPGQALSRSSELTRGRRGGIFGLTFLMGLIVLGILFAYVAPTVANHHGDSASLVHELKKMAIGIVVFLAIFQLFTGIVQAVSYSLLRTDKEGVSNEQLASVFE